MTNVLQAMQVSLIWLVLHSFLLIQVCRNKKNSVGFHLSQALNTLDEAFDLVFLHKQLFEQTAN